MPSIAVARVSSVSALALGASGGAHNLKTTGMAFPPMRRSVHEEPRFMCRPCRLWADDRQGALDFLPIADPAGGFRLNAL
jgi:hypothetical protein